MAEKVSATLNDLSIEEGIELALGVLDAANAANEIPYSVYSELQPLKSFPPPSEVASLALALVNDLAALNISDLSKFLIRRGWEVVFQPLGDEASAIRSLLVPKGSGQFRVVITSRCAYEPERVEWLVAHEYAHSLFFVDHGKARRLVPWVEAEEAFCDAFADQFARAQGRAVLPTETGGIESDNLLTSEAEVTKP